MSVLIGLPTTSTLVLPTLTGCRIYVHDVATASGVRLHPRYTPCGWPHVQHADETWLSQALASSPWRVQSVADADLVYLDGHDFSRWCTASRILNMRNTQRREDGGSETVCPSATPVDQRPAKIARLALWERSNGDQITDVTPTPLFRDEKSKRVVWELMLNTSAALLSREARGNKRLIPRAVALTSNECPPPYRPASAPREQDLVLLVDQKPRAFDAITPYVVSSPDWLVGSTASGARAEPPSTVPWAERRLLFFAGHTPKLTQSVTRYLLWKQLRRSPHVTALSSTIGCNIASYEVCESKERVDAEFGSFCRRWCHSNIMCTGSAFTLRRHCTAVRALVDFADERDDLLNASRPGHLPHVQYLALARSHRFWCAGIRSAWRGGPCTCTFHMATCPCPCPCTRSAWRGGHVALARAPPAGRCLPLHPHALRVHSIVAPGDFVSTHKITEAMALGGSGGCIPLFVLPVLSRSRGRATAMARARARAGGGAAGTAALASDEGQQMASQLGRMLPYTSWLDYCKVTLDSRTHGLVRPHAHTSCLFTPDVYPSGTHLVRTQAGSLAALAFLGMPPPPVRRPVSPTW